MSGRAATARLQAFCAQRRAPPPPTPLAPHMDSAGVLAQRFDAVFWASTHTAAVAAPQPQPPEALPAARAWGQRYYETVDASEPALADAAFMRGYLLFLQQPAVAAGSPVIAQLMDQAMAQTLQLLLAKALALWKDLRTEARRREGDRAAKRAADSLLRCAETHRAKAMRTVPPPPNSPSTRRDSPPKPPAPKPPPPKPPSAPAAVEVQPPLVSAPATAPACAATADVPRFRAHAKLLAMPPRADSADAHRHTAALNVLLAQPTTQLVLWVAPPPRRMAHGALLTGFVVRADRALGTLGAARGEEWTAFFGAVDGAVAFHGRGSDGNGNSDGAPLTPEARRWDKRAMGGANVLLRAWRSDPPPVPAALREALLAPPTALLRAPLEKVRGSTTSRHYAVDEMATLLDAGRSGFGVPVHAVVARGLARPRKDGAPGTEARYRLLSVQAYAAHGDLGRFFTSRLHSPMARSAALLGLRQTLFECSVRRYWLFDFRLENFVLFGAQPALHTRGEAADVRCIDLDPDAFRQLHYQRPGDGGTVWHPCLSDADTADAAHDGLVRCVGEGWRPVLLLNLVLVTAVLRHKLASDGLWRDVWWTTHVRRLLAELYSEVKADRAPGSRCNGFGGSDPARPAPAARPVDHEYAAAARVVACANWNAPFDPDLTYVRRDETHHPRDLGCIARDMLRFYTGAYLITEAEEKIFRPLWDAHRNGTLVADPPSDGPVAAAFNFYDTNYRNHFYPCLAFFARKLRPPGPYATHTTTPNIVDVVVAYADTSAAALAAEGARDLCGRDRFVAEVLANPAALELPYGKERTRNRDRDRWLGVAGILHWAS